MANNQIFAKGVKMDTNFKGTAFVNFLIPDSNGDYNCQVYDVLFVIGEHAHSRYLKHSLLKICKF